MYRAYQTKPIQYLWKWRNIIWKKGCGEEVLGNYLHLWSGVDKGARARAGVSILIQEMEIKDKKLEIYG
jgi:hypothetical protein